MEYSFPFTHAAREWFSHPISRRLSPTFADALSEAESEATRLRLSCYLDNTTTAREVSSLTCERNKPCHRSDP